MVINMIRMILADDEPVITRGIQKLLDWKGLGIEITGEYEDGKRAFEAIIREKPDIALLDISMPGMSGVEILKECRALGSETAITFISGFQDFEYAKAALEYGAVAYLLKPVIREELLRAIEKSIHTVNADSAAGLSATGEIHGHSGIDYERLMEDGNICYVPVYADVVYGREENRQIKKLIQFSLLSFLEEYLNETGQGIVFQKKDKIAVVLKETKEKEARKNVEEIWEQSLKATGHTTFFVVGDPVRTMSEIPDMFRQCTDRGGYLFFADKMAVPVIDLHEKVFALRRNPGSLEELRQKLLDAILAQSTAQIKDAGREYGKMVLHMAEGNKEDACFYFCTAVRFIEERFNAFDLQGRKAGMKNLLEESRGCAGFSEMEDMFEREFMRYPEILKSAAVSSDKKDILKARDYIEKHYMENLSLNVLAEEIHMNPYYFSSFFKKNTGENFKDYVNRIRIEHALPLLLSSDLKTYEIAEKVGFGDVRMFNAAFLKIHQETPGNYRRRVRES